MPVLREEEVHRIRKRLEERRKSQVEICLPETAEINSETGSRRALQESSPLQTPHDILADDDVSYRVYRLADLDARRASLASAPVQVIEPTDPLERIGRAAADSMNLAVAWTKSDRSSGFIQTLRPSFTTLIASMRLLDGRLLARRAAIVVTSMMFLVGAILILAEVTDDVRPVQARASTSIGSIVPGNQPVPPQPKVEARAPVTTTTEDVAPARSPPKKMIKKTAKREVEIFLP